jgi:hypothetical protein
MTCCLFVGSAARQSCGDKQMMEKGGAFMLASPSNPRWLVVGLRLRRRSRVLSICLFDPKQLDCKRHRMAISRRLGMPCANESASKPAAFQPDPDGYAQQLF